MDKQDFKEALMIILVLCFVVFAIFFVIRLVNDTNNGSIYQQKSFCRLKYDSSAIGSDDIRGRYCIVTDWENDEYIEKYYTKDEVIEYCGKIPFWSLTKWGNAC